MTNARHVVERCLHLLLPVAPSPPQLASWASAAMAAPPPPPGATRAPAHVPPSGAGIRADGTGGAARQHQHYPQQQGGATAGPSSSSSAGTQQQQQAAAAAAAAAATDTLSVILVTAGYDHTIRFWEAWSGICSRTIPHSDSQVNRLAISPDKRFLAAAGHTHVRLYDCSHGGMGSGMAAGSTMGASATGGVAGTGMGGGQAGQHGSGGAGGSAGGGGGNPIATFDGHTGNVTSLAWHCDAKWLVTGSEDGTLKIWDTRTSRPQRIYDHRNPVNDVVVHPNQGELISCDQGGSVKVWDLGENGCSHELVPEEDVPIRSVTVASDGSCLVAGNNVGNVYVWRIQNGTYDDPSALGGDGADAAATLSTSLGGTPLGVPPVGTKGNGDFTDLQPVTKFQAHDKYLIRCLLSPDVRYVSRAAGNGQNFANLLGMAHTVLLSSYPRASSSPDTWRRVRQTQRSRSGARHGTSLRWRRRLWDISDGYGTRPSAPTAPTSSRHPPTMLHVSGN